MTNPDNKLQKLHLMAQCLVDALKTDLAALENGKPREFKLVEPELQRLAAAYERETANLSKRELDAEPAELRAKYTGTVGELHRLLKQQQRLLARMRHVTEGIIRAVAEELARRESSTRPYSRSAPSRSPGAMVYNALS